MTWTSLWLQLNMLMVLPKKATQKFLLSQSHSTHYSHSTTICPAQQLKCFLLLVQLGWFNSLYPTDYSHAHRVCLMYWRQNQGKDLMHLVRRSDQDPRLDDGQDLPGPKVQGALSRWKCSDTTCGGVVLTPTTSLRSRWAGGIRSSHSRGSAQQNNTVNWEIFTLKISCVKNFHGVKFLWFCSIREIFFNGWRWGVPGVFLPFIVYHEVLGEPGIASCSHRLDIYLGGWGLPHMPYSLIIAV